MLKLAALGLALLLGAPPTASLVTKPAATAGELWQAAIAVRGASPASLVVVAVSGDVRRSARAVRTRPGRYRVRVVFPTAGPWLLSARLGSRTVRLGVVRVAPARLELSSPGNVLAAANGSLYLAESGRQRVLQVEPSTGRTSVVATGFANPFGLAELANGHVLVTSRNTLSDVDPGTGATRLVAAIDAGVELGPIAVRDGFAYAGSSDERVRRVHLASGAVDVVAGSGVEGDSGDGGPALAARITAVHGLAFDRDGTLLLGDTGNHRIRRLDLVRGTIAAAFGDLRGVGTVVVGPDGAVYAGEMSAGRVTRIDTSGARTTIGGFQIPCCLQLAPGGGLFVVDSGTSTLHRVAPDGAVTRLVLQPP